MIEEPSALARLGNSVSHTVKQCSEIAGILERRGRIFAPAGMMWSVVMLSSTFKEQVALIFSAIAEVLGNSLMFGPRSTSTLSISSTEAGSMTMLSLIKKCSGMSTL